MLDLARFQNLALRGGFRIAEVQLTAKPLLDPLERAASAHRRSSEVLPFHIFLRVDLDEKELSVSMYHDVLEAATVAADVPPPKVMEFNEGHFEAAGQSAHQRLGIASPGTLNQFLAEFGF